MGNTAQPCLPPCQACNGCLLSQNLLPNPIWVCSRERDPVPASKTACFEFTNVCFGWLQKFGNARCGEGQGGGGARGCGATLEQINHTCSMCMLQHNMFTVTTKQAAHMQKGEGYDRGVWKAVYGGRVFQRQAVQAEPPKRRRLCLHADVCLSHVKLKRRGRGEAWTSHCTNGRTSHMQHTVSHAERWQGEASCLAEITTNITSKARKEPWGNAMCCSVTATQQVCENKNVIIITHKPYNIRGKRMWWGGEWIRG